MINLLSGVSTSPSSTMHIIPEQLHTCNLQLPVFPHGSISPSSSDLIDDASLPMRSQRRSEGSIDLTGFDHLEYNTWPNQHRASLPGKLVSLVFKIPFN